MGHKDSHEQARRDGEREHHEGIQSDDAAGRWLDAAEAGLGSPLLAASSAGWRREPQTSGQARLLRALGVNPLGLSRGEASAAISAKQKRPRA